MQTNNFIYDFLSFSLARDLSYLPDGINNLPSLRFFNSLIDMVELGQHQANTSNNLSDISEFIYYVGNIANKDRDAIEDYLGKNIISKQLINNYIFARNVKQQCKT